MTVSEKDKTENKETACTCQKKMGHRPYVTVQLFGHQELILTKRMAVPIKLFKKKKKERKPTPQNPPNTQKRKVFFRLKKV